MKEKIDGIKFTARFHLQGKVRTFIKTLNYDIESVSNFDKLEQIDKDDLISWKEDLCKNMRTKLIACYEEIVNDIALEDDKIFRLLERSKKMEP